MIGSVRKIAAALIGVAMAVSGAAATSAAAAAAETDKTATTQTTTTAKALNNSDVTMIAFQQSWNTIAKECTDVYGPEGVGYVQISPPQESIRGTEWWTVYQPISYSLNSRFGTEDELKNMITTCRDAGVQVIADVVLNHTSGHDVAWVDDQVGVAGTVYNGTYGRYPGIGIYQYEENGNNHQYGLPSGDFHSCRDDIKDYTNVREVQECRLLTMWDINTGSSHVQDIQSDYLAHLWNIGVRGFRIDSSKHISTADLAGIKAKLAAKIGVPTSAIPFQQEVIYHPGEASELALSNYTSNGDVTEFSYATQLKQYFNDDISRLQYITNGLLPSDKATVFVSNWDTARGSETLTAESGSRYELANAFMLAYDYGKPKLMSDYYFTEDQQDAGATGTTETQAPYVDFDTACTASGNSSSTAVAASEIARQQGDWLCEQRWASVRGMIGFHNAVAGTSVANWQNNGTNNIGFARRDAATGEDKGFIAINNTLQEHQETYKTNLPEGIYCNVYTSGAKCDEVEVKDGQFTTTIGKRSAVAIYAGMTKDDWKGYGDKGTADSGYDDEVATGRIGDTDTTIYYKPSADWGENVYIQYASGDNLPIDTPLKMTKVSASSDSCAAADGWYQITIKDVTSKRLKYRFTNGNGAWDYHNGTTNDAENGVWYEYAVGTVLTAIQNHDETIGVPFTCAVTPQTTFTVHFKAANDAQAKATGVVVWADGLAAEYHAFNATENDGTKRMTTTLKGDYTKVQYRIVGSDSTDAEAVDGTSNEYDAAVTDYRSGSVLAKVHGSIESWVEQNVAYDKSSEARKPASNPQPNDVKNPKKLTITVHYMRADANYQEYNLDKDAWNGWDLWTWSGEQTGSAVKFTDHDDYGMIATYTLTQETKGNRSPEFILRKGGDSWSGKDPDADRLIPESAITVAAGQTETGAAEIWLIGDDPTIYTHRPAVSGVTFETLFDWNVSPQAVPYGGTVSPVADNQKPKRPGYIFNGWSTSENGSTGLFKFGEGGTPVYGRLKLWAQYTKANLVSFDTGEGGSWVDAQTVADGGKATQPADPTREGYTFDGWYTKADDTGAKYDFNTAVSGDMTLYAHWKIKEFTVTFSTGDGGSAVASQRVNYGETVTKPATDPTMDGKKFIGWVTDDGSGNATDTPYFFTAKVTSDLTLHAKWGDPNDTYHIVTFHDNAAANGSGDVADVTAVYVKAGEKVTAPGDGSAPTRDGYRLDRWTSDAAGKTTFDFTRETVTDDLDLYAQWVKVWTLSFNLNYDGAPMIDPQTVDEGIATSDHGAVEPTVPTRDRYKFAGWYTSKDLTDDSKFTFGTSTVTADTTLYAKWEKSGDVWTITFDLNGGELPTDAGTELNPQQVYDGEKLLKPTKNPVREGGYTFQGWTTVRNDALATGKDDGTDTFTGGSAFGFEWNSDTNRYESKIPIDRNGTLYALWAKNQQ